MPEPCNPENCPVNARVDVLEKEFDRYRTEANGMHREMDGRIGALEQSGAAVQEKLDSMDEKLDGLTESVKALTDKPGKRWDGLVDKLIYAAALAVVAWIAAGAPGLG